MSLNFVDVGLVTLALYFLKNILTPAPKTRSLPPGPKGLPLLGNAADMPTQQEWKTFSDWGRVHGDLMSVTIFGQPLIIVNSVAHARALLDVKSAIYSDRPKLVMGGELVGWENTLALTPYGSRFRSIRRLVHGLMGSRSGFVNRFGGTLELETHRLLRRVCEHPEGIAGAIRKTAGAIILRISHGYQVQEHDDPLVACVDTATEQFSAATAPGAFFVDIIPALRHIPAWVPGAGFQRKAALWRDTLMRMADRPHALVKAQMATGTVESNFTSEHLERKGISSIEEETIKWSAASLYSGGADTTVSANYVFYLAMTLYPEAQAKAQAEIDSVIGQDRLPTLDDRLELPYVDALVKEVFRWQPVTPLGVPHRLMEDDVHAGYLIPEGSLIIPNIWHMLHDPTVYVDPMDFKPERFIGSPIHTAEPDPKEIAFGFGRRACPGAHLADVSVWLACAMSLTALNVSKARNPRTGEEITPIPEMTSGTISHPVPFPCIVHPRSARHAELVTAVDFATATTKATPT